MVGERIIFVGVFIFVILVSYILRAFLIKQLFHSDLRDMRCLLPSKLRYSLLHSLRLAT